MNENTIRSTVTYVRDPRQDAPQCISTAKSLLTKQATAIVNSLVNTVRHYLIVTAATDEKEMK